MKKEMMMLKAWLEHKKIEKADFDAMDAEGTAKVYNELQENNVAAFKELQESGASAEDLSKALKTMTKEQNEKIEKILVAMSKGSAAAKEQGIAIAKLLKNGSATPKNVTVSSIIKGAVKENFEEIKGLRPNSGEVEIKADFTTASILNNTDGTRDRSISELNTQELNLRNIYPSETVTGSNNYIYTDWDDATVVRAAAMVAECAVFPESSAGFIERNITMHKVGDTIPVCQEVWEDEARFGNELVDFLKTNVAIVINNQLLNGDNTGENLRGLINSGTTYVPVASQVADANVWDVARNMSLVMSKLGKKFRASHLIMNETEYYKMTSTKDGNNNYLKAPFVSADGNKIGSMTVVIDNEIPDDQMIALDNRFGKILNKVGMQVSRGMINDQFTKDQETLKVRERLNLLIKESNRSSVQICTSIAAAETAIAL